jgi:hypothetical protein
LPSKLVSRHHVKVVDLGAALWLGSSSSPPNTISEITVSKWQPICNIEFTGNGNSLIISTEGGRIIRVYQLRPIPSVLRNNPVASTDDARRVAAEPWHVYNLQRGRISAFIGSIGVLNMGVGQRWERGSIQSTSSQLILMGGNLTTGVISMGGSRILPSSVDPW